MPVTGIYFNINASIRGIEFVSPWDVESVIERFPEEMEVYQKHFPSERRWGINGYIKEFPHLVILVDVLKECFMVK